MWRVLLAWGGGTGAGTGAAVDTEPSFHSSGKHGETLTSWAVTLPLHVVTILKGYEF